MEVTITQFSIDDYRGTGSTAYLQVVANSQFTDLDGDEHLEGSYKEYPLVVNTGAHRIDEQTIIVTSTTDAIVNQNATYTFRVLDANRKNPLEVVVTSLPHSLGPTVTWATLMLRARAQLPWRDIETYTKTEVELLIGQALAVGSPPDATEIVKGKAYILVHDVRMYGATGDGTTDDSAAVAVAAAAAAGKVLYFSGGPAKSYVISGINIAANTIVLSDGAIVKYKVQTVNVGPPIFQVQGSGVVFRGLRLDGTRTAQPVEAYSLSWGSVGSRDYRCGIRADGVTYTISDLRIEDCEFRDFWSSPIASRDVNKFYIDGNRSYNSAGEFLFSATSAGWQDEIVITNNRIDTIQATGATPTGAGGNGLHISAYRKCVISNNIANDIERGFVKMSVQDLTMTGNVVKRVNVESSAAAPLVTTVSGGATFPMLRVLIADNIFSDCTDGISMACETGDSITIVNNLIDGVSGTGSNGDAVVLTATATLTNVLVANNTFRNIYRHGVLMGAPAGGNWKIAGNVMSGKGASSSTSSLGIFISSSGNISGPVEVLDNTLTGFRATAGHTAGILLANTNPNTYASVQVRGNTIPVGNTTFYAIDLGTAASPVFITAGLLSHNWTDGVIFSYQAGVVTRDNQAASVQGAQAHAKFPRHLTTTLAWNPASVADGAVVNGGFALAGAAVGDPCYAGHDQLTVANVLISAVVTAADVVFVTILNKTGAPLDIPAGNVKIGLWKY